MPLSSTPIVVGRNAHTEASFQLIAKGAPNKILPFYSSSCEIAQVQPVHQVRHDVSGGFRGGSGGSLEPPSGTKLFQFLGEIYEKLGKM